jgi:formylglycine-generating enzyme required for sulfatase activity
MKQKLTFLLALLLVGAASMMTAGAQNSGKPTLAVFVVGGDNTLVTPLTTALRTNLTSSEQYTLTSVSTSGKLTELQAAYTAGGGSSINRDTLAAWGGENGISAICLVVDDIKGSDHLFSAQLIDTKDSKLSGKGSYVRTSVGTGDAARVALALAKQLEGSGRRRSAPAPAHSYPAELDIEMVFVEGGTFEMGCTPEQVSECQNDEKPVHTVEVSSFSIGKFEITRAQWIAVMANHPTLANPGANKADDQLPIDNVSWNDITGEDGFLKRLNALTGKSYRLPTEAEWEYAARGGKHKSPYKHSGSNNLDEVAWVTSTSGGRTHVVGGKKPNALGIYDMNGNVFEWCLDFYDVYSSTMQKNPTGPLTGVNQVRRGGVYTSSIAWARVATRGANLPTDRLAYSGFRVVLPAQ